MQELSGKTVGKITIIEPNGKDKSGKGVYKCRCGCGHEFNVRKSVLLLNRIKSCRNCKRPKDLQGLSSGELQVLEFDKMGKYGNLWRCRCSCGNVVSLSTNTFLSGNTRSCGKCKAFLGNKSKAWRGYGEISSHYYTQLKHNASVRNIDFDVKIEDLWNLFLEQDRKCVLSSIELCFARSYKNEEKRKQTASLDRIDSSKPYTIDNVQWVHKTINMMKRGLSDAEFINVCKLVANRNSGS